MRLLLDTHALLWWIFGARRLSPAAFTAIEDPENEVLVSAASICEIAIKLSLNKLTLAAEFDRDLFLAISETGFAALPITAVHARELGQLPWHHRDPFDRLLVAQSRSEHLILVARDPVIRRYEARFFW